MKCTWEGCEAEAEVEELAKDGEIWACLCRSHDDCLNQAIQRGRPPEILSSWVRAQGGPKHAVQRLMRKA